MDNMARILPLPAEAISQIHSSKHITSLQDVVIGLLANSLDARSTKVEIAVDFRRGGCTVDDDGDGIPLTEFSDGGGLGKMYHTSKRSAGFEDKQDLHGYAGTFLASVASLSLLTISSRQNGQTDQAKLSMHVGKPIRREEYEAASLHPDQTMSQGTQVAVRDLFGNMPVRVKQRALVADHGNNDEKAWYQMKHAITALLLAWPRPCSVRLIDAHRPDRRVHVAGSHASTYTPLTRDGLRQLEKGSGSAFGAKEALPMVFQAGVASLESRSSWIPISASAVDFKVKGLICLEPAPTKQCQFLSLGIHPLSVSSGYSDLYHAINTVFSNSSFGTVEDLSDVDQREKDRRRQDRRYKGEGYTQKQLHGRKGVDRWPMFILQIAPRDRRLQRNASRMPSDAALKGIVEVLEATVTQWLIAHHFRPHRKRKRRRDDDDQERPVSSLSRRSSGDRAMDAGSMQEGTSVPDRPRTESRSSTAASWRKRKIIDLSSRPQSTGRVPSRQPADTESPFASWSHVKRGRRISDDDETPARKIAAAPAPRADLLAGPARVGERPPFTLAPVESGLLNTSHPRDIPATPINTVTQPPSEVSGASSESFGSFDDEGIIAATAGVESTTEAHEEVAGLMGAHTDDVVDWIDPKSKQRFKVNARTGVVLPMHSRQISEAQKACGPYNDRQRHCAAINNAVSHAGRPLRLDSRTTLERATARVGGNEDSAWLPGFLQQWNNPVFSRPDEESIPVAKAMLGVEDQERDCGLRLPAEDFRLVGAKSIGPLTKGSLRSAKVISQVDRKFILCKAPASSGPKEDRLVLVDQHAASERVILEGLFAELCEPPFEAETSIVKTSRLEKALRFQISAKEHDLFLSHKRRFADWGILYDSLQREAFVPASQDCRSERKQEHLLIVTHLLPGISERCTLVPRILIEMLRSEVWDVDATKKRPTAISTEHDRDSASEPGDGHAWLGRIGSCPKGIIEMLNSRACRSAIMFNDELSVQQCEELIGKLSKCAFPFMCAHGRVSMVPLIGLGGDDGNGADDGMFLDNSGIGDRLGLRRAEEGNEISAGAAFTRWMQSENSSGQCSSGKCGSV